MILAVFCVSELDFALTKNQVTRVYGRIKMCVFIVILAEGVRSNRPQIADRKGEDHSFIQNEDLRPRSNRRQIQVLVFLETAEKIQEVHR